MQHIIRDDHFMPESTLQMLIQALLAKHQLPCFMPVLAWKIKILKQPVVL